MKITVKRMEGTMRNTHIYWKDDGLEIHTSLPVSRTSRLGVHIWENMIRVPKEWEYYETDLAV